MLHTAIQVVLYGLLAGLSPLAVTATVAVTQAGRVKALGFATGLVAAQFATCMMFVSIGVAATGASTTDHPGVQALLEVALALTLSVAALRVRRRPPADVARSGERTQALFDRLSRLRFLTTILAGLLLGIGGPKRLLITAFAATTITAAAQRGSGEAALVVLYVALATALVWGPVILFVLLGKRAVVLTNDAQREVTQRQPKVTVYALVILAALLAIDAVGVLLAEVF